MEYYLAHHGIKGQKWGRRRWQRPDGSLTPEGYRHYYGNNPNARMTRFGVIDSKTGKMLYQNPTKAQKKENKEAYRAEVRSHYGIDKKEKAYENALSDRKKAYQDYLKTGNADKYNKVLRESTFAKNEVSDAKAYASFKESGKVTKRQEALISKYKEQGLTQKEAEIAAYKRDRAEKIAKVALTATVAAAAAYGAYKYADYAFDKKLTTKTTLSRVSKELQEGGDRGVFDAFYAVNDKSAHDKARYAGLYAQQMRQGVYGYIAPKVYEKKIGVNSAIKVASRKSAKEIIAKELLKGDNLSTLTDELGGWGAYGGMNYDIEKLKKTGKISGRLYDHINRHLVNRNLDTTKTFYKALKDAGYGAVKDVNDAKYSGFRTRLPMIIFDSSKVSVKQVQALSDSDINRKAARVFVENTANETLKEIAPTVTLYGTLIGAVAGETSYSKSRQESKIVTEYRRKHPNSKLSRNEIIRNYNG